MRNFKIDGAIWKVTNPTWVSLGYVPTEKYEFIAPLKFETHIGIVLRMSLIILN